MYMLLFNCVRPTSELKQMRSVSWHLPLKPCVTLKTIVSPHGLKSFHCIRIKYTDCEEVSECNGAHTRAIIDHHGTIIHLLK